MLRVNRGPGTGCSSFCPLLTLQLARWPRERGPRLSPWKGSARENGPPGRPALATQGGGGFGRPSPVAKGYQFSEVGVVMLEVETIKRRPRPLFSPRRGDFEDAFKNGARSESFLRSQHGVISRVSLPFMRCCHISTPQELPCSGCHRDSRDSRARTPCPGQSHRRAQGVARGLGCRGTLAKKGSFCLPACLQRKNRFCKYPGRHTLLLGEQRSGARREPFRPASSLATVCCGQRGPGNRGVSGQSKPSSGQDHAAHWACDKQEAESLTKVPEWASK